MEFLFLSKNDLKFFVYRLRSLWLWWRRPMYLWCNLYDMQSQRPKCPMHHRRECFSLLDCLTFHKGSVLSRGIFVGWFAWNNSIWSDNLPNRKLRAVFCDSRSDGALSKSWQFDWHWFESIQDLILHWQAEKLRICHLPDRQCWHAYSGKKFEIGQANTPREHQILACILANLHTPHFWVRMGKKNIWLK